MLIFAMKLFILLSLENGFQILGFFLIKLRILVFLKHDVPEVGRICIS